MIHLTPYESPKYFILLAIFLLPVVISLLLRGKHLHVYEMFVTFLFLWLSFGGPEIKQGLALLVYVLWQVLLTKSYFSYRSKNNRSSIFYGVVFLSILPLVLVKLAPVLNGKMNLFGFLGISYLTFKAVQTLMEIRDGVLKNYSVKVFNF